MDTKEVLLKSLPILAKLTNSYVALTDKEGNRIEVIDAEGNLVESLRNRKLDVAAKSIKEGAVVTAPSELTKEGEIWSVPLGDFAIVVTDDGRKQRELQLEFSLKESLALIANVIDGEASLFNEIGLITHSINRNGTVNDNMLGQINQEAHSAMSIRKSIVTESPFIPGAQSVVVPITKRFGIEMSCLPAKEKAFKDKSDTDSKRKHSKYSFSDMIGESESFLKAKDISLKAAKSSSPVLLLGESGTGKELFAQSIHDASDRADQKFIALNCGAIPDNLIESILFGYESGTFTGGTPGGKKGIFIEANKGTVFLDEISEMGIALQSRLLRVLQEKEVMPLGSTKSQEVDVRIIAATNRNIKQLIQDGSFREDLYYRLNVMEVNIPPLRRRSQDIELLANYFVKQFNISMKKQISGCSSEVIKALKTYHWPGNIRELRNCVERAINFIDEGQIDLEHLPGYVFEVRHQEQRMVMHDGESLDESLRRLERELIEQTLQQTNHNKQEAAKKLGISTTTLWRKLNQSDLEEEKITRIK